MATVAIEVPDELSELLAQADDRLPEFLAQSLKGPTLPAHVYRYVLDFLASRPTPEQSFRSGAIKTGRVEADRTRHRDDCATISSG